MTKRNRRRLLALIFPLVVIVSGALSTSCASLPTDQIVKVASSDEAKRQVFAVLLVAYVTGGNALIDSSATADEAEGKLATYEDAWARVWLAYEAWRTLATLDSFCMLARVSPVTIPGSGLCAVEMETVKS